MKWHILIILLFTFPLELFSQSPPQPFLQSGETWTNLYSLSYDYQGSGSVRYIVQDPNNSMNLCAIMMAQNDTTSQSGSERNIYYSYSDDQGDTWTSDVITTAYSQGFPCISLRNGVPVFSAYQPGVGMHVWEDVIFGGFSLTELTGIQNPQIWGQIAGTSNSNLVMAASESGGTSFNGQYTTYNNGNWSSPLSLPHINGSSGSYSVASGSNGIAGIFGINSNDRNKIYYYKSTDNGITFDNGTMIFDYQIAGTDTLFASPVGGLQAVYLGDIPHLVFAVYNTANTVFPNPYTTAFISPRILHWSPPTGITIVADKNNIPYLTDTITNSFVTPLCQPSIGLRGSGLLVSFTAYLRGNTQTVDNGDVLNAGEIIISYSSDLGVNWPYRGNVTNTPYIEEKYSSVLPEGSTILNGKLFYLRDMKAGNWVTNQLWGKAPVYGIYKKLVTVGIQQNISTSETFELSQNYPNPFNPSTNIQFSLNKSGLTKLVVYDTRGREIAQLVNEVLSEGSYTYSFDTGKYNLPSGVYFYKLTSGEKSKVNKMMLVR